MSDPADPANPLEPPRPRTAGGDVRRVGVEIEFGGLAVSDAATAVGNLFGGKIAEENPNRFVVENTEHGDFVVELDADKLHPPASDDEDAPRHTPDETAPLDELIDKVSAKTYEVLGAIAGTVVPVEIVAPPLPWNEIPALDELLARLREAGAQGTDDGLSYAFGTHLNPEVADMDAAYVCAHLKSYLVLSANLRRDIDIDPARVILPFVDPFPDEYADKVVDPAYAPGWATLIDDYLAWNPSRNRELDLLPLFSEKDSTRVRRAVDDDRIKSRPTFHYRLPQSYFSQPSWNITVEWNRWVAVERLAADAKSLKQAAESFLKAGRSESAISALTGELEKWFTVHS